MLISGNGNETKKKVSALEEENKKLKAQLAQSEEVRMKAESAEAISRTQAEDAIRKLAEEVERLKTKRKKA
jgi:vacuolar-type H+-ATPase subunit I/STV1